MASWTELMRSEIRTLRVGGKIVFGSGVEVALDGDHISEICVEEGADGALLPGDVLSTVCTADLVNDQDQWLSGGACLGGQVLVGATFLPKIIAMDGDAAQTRPLGVFQIESALAVEKEAKIRIRAVDSLSFELGGAFEDQLVYPQTLRSIWLHAVGQTRYVFQGDVPNGDCRISARPAWGDISVRQALGYIAAAAGCFVQADRSGALKLARVWGGTAKPIGAASYLRLETDSAAFGPVDSIALLPVGEAAQEEYYTLSEGGAHLYSISVQNNPLFASENTNLSALAQGLLGKVAGYATQSMRFDWRGDPEIGIGDRIALTDADGRVHEGVLSRQSLRFSAAFSASCACVVPENSDSGVMRAITPEGGLNASALVGKVNGALLSAGSVTTIKLAAGSVTAEKLAAGAVDAQSLAAVAAKVGTLTAEDIKTDSLAAALAAFTVITAGTAEFDRATVAHLVAEALNLQFGVADQVYIKNLAVEYAQMVGAAIGNLCIKASDGNYYAIDVDEDGNVIANVTEVSEDEIEAGQTDGGRVLLETSITAQSLNTSNLLATYALINQIDAARIDVDVLLAREAFITKLITSHIFSNGSSLEIVAAATDEMQKWFKFTNDRGLIIRKPEYTDASGVVHPASIWYTVTDEVGYHIYNTQQTAPVGSFQRGGLNTTGVTIGDIACKRTTSGGWVWTDTD